MLDKEYLETQMMVIKVCDLCKNYQLIWMTLETKSPEFKAQTLKTEWSTLECPTN